MQYPQAKIKVNQALYTYLHSLEGKEPCAAEVTKITNELIAELRMSGFTIYMDKGIPISTVEISRRATGIHVQLNPFTEDYTYYG